MISLAGDAVRYPGDRACQKKSLVTESYNTIKVPVIVSSFDTQMIN